MNNGEEILKRAKEQLELLMAEYKVRSYSWDVNSRDTETLYVVDANGNESVFCRFRWVPEYEFWTGHYMATETRRPTNSPGEWSRIRAVHREFDILPPEHFEVGPEKPDPFDPPMDHCGGLIRASRWVLK